MLKYFCIFLCWRIYSVFRKSLCTYKKFWKWCPWASIQAWTNLILFANAFRRSAFGKSLCTNDRCWKWCPRVNNALSRYRNPHSWVHSDFLNTRCTYTLHFPLSTPVDVLSECFIYFTSSQCAILICYVPYWYVIMCHTDMLSCAILICYHVP
jgi:hypothetical protein